MRGYYRLTQAERYQIAALIESGFTIRAIGEQLKRSPGTISRELRRNRTKRGQYKAEAAHTRCHERRAGVGPPVKLNGPLANQVSEKIRLKWSPEQISGYLQLTSEPGVSHETIYKFIYEDFQNCGDLWTHLRRRRKFRRTRLSSKRLKNCGVRANRVWITERPAVVEKRIRLGDFERDTVECTKGSCLLLTMVDRTSRLTKIRWIARKNAALVHEATVEALNGLATTITNDNGPEFSMHDFTAQALGIGVYFSHPYHSWERGTNENTNGLIRQYFPVGRDPDPAMVQEVETHLNSRPRKCLGFKTPYQVHEELKSGVALSY